MKFLLLFFIAMVLVFQWRQARKPKVQRQAQKPATGSSTMLACAMCGLHVPEADVVRGLRGVYCSTAHRQALEP